MTLCMELFWTFFKIGLMSFGGLVAVLPELEKIIVSQQGWMNRESFMQAYVISQFVPGPNIAMGPLIGHMVNGWPGFVAAFIGIYSGPFLVMTGIYYFYRKYSEISWVRRIEFALRPVIIGLLTSSILRVWWAQSRSDYFPQTFRILILLVTIGGLFLHAKKTLTAMELVILMGGAWLLMKLWFQIGFLIS